MKFSEEEKQTLIKNGFSESDILYFEKKPKKSTAEKEIKEKRKVKKHFNLFYQGSISFIE